MGDVGGLGFGGVSRYFFVQFELMFEFGVLLGEFLVEFEEEGEFDLLGVFEGSGFFGPGKGGK